ncbi:hypothetical protein MBLNU457_2031t1 [Dothideomycetes sp. NU457]
MSSTNDNKYDYRGNLKKVDPPQQRSPTAPSVSSFDKQPLAFRPFSESNGQSTISPGGLKPSISAASKSSSIYSTALQSQLDTSETSVGAKRLNGNSTTTQTSVAAPSIRQPSLKAPSIYSQRSVGDTSYGPKNLLVISAGGPFTDLQQYIHTSVQRHDIGSIILLGSDEESIKRSKMDCYTVAGKLEKNLSVATSIVKSGTNDTSSLSQSLQSLGNRNIHGVLTYLGPSVPEDDILDLDEPDMTSAWRTSILTLQTIAKHTIPLLARQQQAQAQNARRTYASMPFFATTQEKDASAAPTFHATVQSALLQSIARSPMANGVRIGSVQEILPPPPPPPSVSVSHSPRPSVSAGIDIPQPNGGRVAEDDVPENMSESPTKLWALYANAMANV